MLEFMLADFPLYAFLTTLALLLGACIGSFLNVCIYRIPLEQSVITPGSHCPVCNTPLRWYHNIPIFSYLILRGRCAYCHNPFSARYCLVETLGAILFLLVWLKLDVDGAARPYALVPIADWKLVPVYWLVVMGLILGTFVDFDHMIIPDRVTIGGMLAGVLCSVAVPSLHGQTSHLHGLLTGLLGLAVGFGSLWLVACVGKLVFRKDAMGFGDVKLMGAIGAFFGWQAVLFTIMMSSLLGSIAGVTLIVCGGKQLQSRIPFGPYLALATLLWMLWGSTWWAWYVNFLLQRA
jgi:leader peptidase (prepilin peptidase) / N-methyltransferase